MTRHRILTATLALAVLFVGGLLPSTGASFTSGLAVSGSTVTTGVLPARAPTATAFSSGSVILSWEPAPNGGATPEYTLIRRTANTPDTIVYTGTARTYIDGGTPATQTPLALRSTAAGRDHSLAVDSDGRVWAWGNNDSGQLGTGGTGGSTGTPARVDLPAGVTVTAIAAGYKYSLALDSDGRVWAWGNNDSGQLGTGGTGGSTGTPARTILPAGITITAITAGRSHSLALDSGGRVWAWGNSDSGQLGTGGTGGSTGTPARTTLPTGVTITTITAGAFYSLALDSGGRVWAWGDNDSGQLGNGRTGGSARVPAQVGLLAGVTFTTIAAGYEYALALDSGGRVWAWGNNDSGQLGTGGTGGSTGTPARTILPAGITITAITAGFAHSLVLASDGQVWSWGNNTYAQLGIDRTSGPKGTPARVGLLAGVTVTAISTGYIHSLVLASDGRAWSWGDNDSGQLGNGATGGYKGTPVSTLAFTVKTCAPGMIVVNALTCSLHPNTNYVYLVKTTIGGWSSFGISASVRTANR